MPVSQDSVLLVSLDSCRYDTFEAAAAPNLKAVGPLHRAMAPSYFTYGSHAAMFVGFTPSVPGAAQPILDSKFGKLFRLADAPFGHTAREAFRLEGGSIIQGFGRLGHRTIGSGAVCWFDPHTEVGRKLSRDFDTFFFPGGTSQLPRQIAWLTRELDDAGKHSVFAFLNVGETHVPYYYEGAPWPASDNPCQPYQRVDRAAECRIRQRACLEYIDAQIAPLLARFAAATVLVCADHGDCWGEDGLWEHGVSHEMTLTVPLLIRLRGMPVLRR
jgi:hypothetical protein